MPTSKLLLVLSLVLVAVGCSSSSSGEDDEDVSGAESASEAAWDPCVRPPPAWAAGTCHVWGRDPLRSVLCRPGTGRGWTAWARSSACLDETPGTVCEDGRRRLRTRDDVGLPNCI